MQVAVLDPKLEKYGPQKRMFINIDTENWNQRQRQQTTEIKSDEYEWFVLKCILADISAKSYTSKNSQANIFWKSIWKHIFI